MSVERYVGGEPPSVAERIEMLIAELRDLTVDPRIKEPQTKHALESAAFGLERELAAQRIGVKR